MEPQLVSALARRRARHGHRSGVALVIALIVLVLMTVMIVTILLTVSSENITAKSQAASASARRLSDVAVQIVMAQIRDATLDQSTAANPTANSGTPCLWASQPGMIRTYDSTGKPNNAFKLYSDSLLKVAASNYNPTGDLASWGDWGSQPALYTDLNAPSQGVYPIFDPSLADTGISMAQPGFPTTSQENSLKRKIDGFYIDTSSEALTVPSNTTNQKAAMPVRWLYVLQDGEVVPPDTSSTGTQVTVNSAKVPPGSTYTVNGVTFTNQIVGRIAFWTDDETCKLNVNTASEGTYWDTPMYCEGEDVAFGFYQPATYEYSRYPGHPATTCLSPALWSFLGLPDPLSSPAATYTSDAGYSYGPSAQGGSTGPTASLSLSGAKTAFTTLLGTAGNPGLVPRNLWAGSQAGSVNTLTSGSFTGLTSSNIRHDRLYDDIDEFLFGPNYNSTARASNAANISAANVAQLRFVLTADSRAPDTNPFGLPKVSIWPSPSKTSTSNPANAAWTAGTSPSAEEQLLAFCSTLQNNAYYFDRHDPTSMTADVSARDQLVYNYVRNLMDKPVPGFGASFTTSKWTSLQADMVLTGVYDYIRSCLNLVDSSNNTGGSAYTFPYSYTNPPAQTGGGTSAQLNVGTGQVIPISITNPDGNTTKGLGRFPTLRAATLMFIARAANQPPLVVDTNSRPVIYDASGNTSNANGPYVSASGFLTQTAGLPLVLSGGAFARTNNLHPWTNAPPKYVPQLIVSGVPVLAYNSTAFLSGTAADAQNLYPIFSLTGNSTITTNTYPTLNGTQFYENYIGTSAPKPTTITISGNKYSYYKAEICTVNGSVSYSLTASGTLANAGNGAGGKTHAGMPFLSLQRDYGNGTVTALGTQKLEGAFDIVNPSYVDTTVNPLSQMTPGTTSIETILIPELQDPAPGNVPYSPNFSLVINNLANFTANGTSLGFLNNQTETIQVGANGSSPGNYNGFFSNISYAPTVSNRYLTGGGKGNTNLGAFPFYGTPVRLTGGATTFPFTGGNLDIKFNTTGGKTIQDITVNFPNSATFPLPKLTPWWSAGEWLDYPPQVDSELVPAWMNTFNLNDAKLGVSSASNPGGFKLSRIAGSASAVLRGQYRFILPEMDQPGMYTQSCDTLESVEAKYGDIRMIAALPVVPSTFYVTNPLYGNNNSSAGVNVTVNSQTFTTYMRAAHSIYLNDCPQVGTQLNFLMANQPAIANYSYIADAGTDLCVTGGPGTSATATTASSVSYPSGTAISNMMEIKFASGDNSLASTTANGAGYNGTGTYVTYPFTTPSMDFTNSAFQTVWQNGGDFDNGEGLYADGPFIGKVDEGDGQNNYYNNTLGANYGVTGASLFSPNRQAPSPVIFGSLPVGFGQTGSLSAPSANMLNNSWQTLMFCPNPNAITSGARDTRTGTNGIPEPGTLPTPGQLPDYALLDFFYMPIVEPYAISASYATAGKVNMNYQIVPYTYINRDTALRGVLKSVMLTAVDDQWIVDYKYRGTNSDNPQSYNRGLSVNAVTPAAIPLRPSWATFGNNTSWQTFRYYINADETLKQFQQRFANLDIFRTPSEICSLWLYPVVPTATPTGGGLGSQASEPLWDAAAANIKSWWYGNPGITRKGLTGTNMRERPYNDIYPRLTTRSNTYTVHYRVQLLKKSTATPAATWIEPNVAGTTGAQDTILGEYRGSSLIERYIDPNDPTLVDFTSAAAAATHNLDYYYKFRIDSSREFAP